MRYAFDLACSLKGAVKKAKGQEGGLNNDVPGAAHCPGRKNRNLRRISGIYLVFTGDYLLLFLCAARSPVRDRYCFTVKRIKAKCSE